MKSLSVIAICLLTAGCAQKAPMTLEQLDSALKANQQAATRIYEGKSIDDVRKASHKVLELLDKRDMTFDVKDKELLATRFSTFYAVFSAGFGRDWYSVRFEELPNGTKATIGFEASMNAGMFPTMIPVSYKSNIPVLASAVPQDYDLFHDRVDYILGNRKDWPTCEEVKKAMKDKKIGLVLCDSLGLENLSPEK